MSFKYTNILLFLFSIPVILFAGYYYFNKRIKIIESFFNKENFEKIGVKRSRGKSFLKYLFISLSFGFFICALAGPQYGYKEIVLNTLGSNIFVAVDTSLSMRATDVKPNRINLAKRKILDLVKMLKGERISLIPFAGEPYVLIPLTSDYSIFKTFIDIVDTDLIPIQGTNFYNLIDKIKKIADKYNLTELSLIILSDGEDFSGNIDYAISLCKKSNIKIYSIGIGGLTPSPIPLKDGGFKKDKNNNLVTTKLNEKFLEHISLETGGIYVRGVQTSKDISYIYKKISKSFEKNSSKYIKKKIYFNRFQWFLFPGFLFLCFYYLIDERWRA